MHAEAVFDRTQPGWCNVEIKVDAASKEEAKAETERLFELIAGDRGCFIRVLPEAESYTNFDSKVTTHRGYARLMLSDEKGERLTSEHVMRKVTFG